MPGRRVRVPYNKVVSIFPRGSDLPASGTVSERFWNENGGAQLYLEVTALTGELQVDVLARISDDSSAPGVVVASFPEQTAVTGDLVLLHLPVGPSLGEVRVTGTGTATYAIWIQGVQPTTAASTLQEGSGAGEDSKVTELPLVSGTWTRVDTLSEVRAVSVKNIKGNTDTVKVNWISPTQPSLPVGFVGMEIVPGAERFYLLARTHPALELYVRSESAQTVATEQLR